MKKLLLIPILAFAMSFGWFTVSTPVASARPHHRGHGYNNHYRHHGYRNYNYYRGYRPYTYYRPYRHHHYDNDSFFFGLAFPGFYFGASQFNGPYYHGPGCYR